MPRSTAIVDSGVREIVMLGRRGPAQAAFTNPELKELGELAGADVVVDPADLVLDEASEAALADARGTARRNVDLLREYAAREPEGKPRRLGLRFLVSPVEIRGDGKVEEVEVVRNVLVDDGRGGLRAVADRGARDDPVRARPPQRRLPRRRASRRAVRSRPRRDPERRRPRRSARTAGRSPGCTAPAGSSAARAA